MKRGKEITNPRSITYRLFPNKEQENILKLYREHYSLVYNDYLEFLNNFFKDNGFDFSKEAHGERKDEWKKLGEDGRAAKYEFVTKFWKLYKENKDLFYAKFKEIKLKHKDVSIIHADGLNDIPTRIETAIKRFLSSDPKFAKAGYPRFNSKYDDNSFNIRLYMTSTKNPKYVSIIFGQNSVKIPKIGRIEWKRHKKINHKFLNMAHLSYKRSTKEYHLCLVYDKEVKNPVCGDEVIGIDLGVKKNACLSNGTSYQWVTPFQIEANKKINELQRQRSRCKGSEKGEKKSNKFLKLNKKIAILHRSIAEDSRREQHITVNKLLEGKKRIILEDLKICNMVKSAKGTKENPGKNVKAKSGLNRVMLGASLGQFVSILEYKAKAAGVELVFVNPRYTSQECNVCGHKESDNRITQAKFECKNCGHASNADVNAAKNILKKGELVTV